MSRTVGRPNKGVVEYTNNYRTHNDNEEYKHDFKTPQVKTSKTSMIQIKLLEK